MDISKRIQIKENAKRLGSGENKSHGLSPEGKKLYEVYTKSKEQKGTSLSRSSEGRN